MAVHADIPSLTLRIYDVVAQPSMLPEVLDDIVGGIGAQAASIAGLDLSRSILRSYNTSELISDLVSDPGGVKALQAERPLYSLLAEEGVALDGPFTSDQVLVDEYQRRRNQPVSLGEFHQFFRDRYDLHHRVLSPLNRSGPQCDYVALHFGACDASKRDAASQLGSQLLPHFAKALSISRPLSALEIRYNSVLDVLDRLRMGVIIAGLDRKVWLSNVAAKEILERRDALRVSSGGCLQGTNDSASHTLDSVFGHLNGVTPGDLLRLRLCLGRNPSHFRSAAAEAYVGDCSLLRHDDLGTGISGVGLLMVLSDPDAQEQVDLGALQQIFALTRSERAVCELLILGYSNAEIAEQRHVSTDTVASQVKSLFTKTSCRKRGELIHLAHRVSVPVLD